MRKMLGLLIILFFAFPALASGLTEEQKIDELLDALASSDVTFIRNGQPLDGEAARSHLEEKFKQVQGVNTAEDFIAKVASVSRESGKPYVIKSKDGKEVESSEWFHSQLKEIESTEVIE